MKILADIQIPFVKQAFSKIGDVTLYEGRKISPRLVSDADILIVRSVTTVDKALLEKSRVKFVATVTSGVDHIDMAYLQSAGVGFVSAHGSNAQSVVEYVLSSLFVLAGQNDFDLFDKSVGIVGCGKVGSRLMSVLKTLGIRFLVNDPPLKDETGHDLYRALSDIINLDIVSLHVPLTDHALYPTRNLVDENFLSKMKTDAVLINTSRGQVVHEQALKKHMDEYNKFSAVIDVWENEPDINLEILRKVDIGTPHIAGYSLDAKIKATEMVFAEACRYFEIKRQWKPEENVHGLALQEVKIDESLSDKEAIQIAILSHYDVRSDAASLRRVLEVERSKAGYYFDELRKNYPVRRNFSGTTVNLPAGRNTLAEMLKSLGFNISWH